jgi:hypothetical protein
MSSLQPVVNIPAHLRANFRRTMILGIAVGVVGLVALVLTGHASLGLFGCLGILLGAVNALLVQRSAVTYGSAGTGGDAAAKKLLTMSIASRLLVTTLVAVIIGIAFAPAGIAVFGGLMVFQLVMMGSTAVPMMRGMHQP